MLNAGALIERLKSLVSLNLAVFSGFAWVRGGRTCRRAFGIGYGKTSAALAISIVLNLGGAPSVFAQSSLPAPCSLYTSYLANGAQIEPGNSNLSDCILYERLVVQADSWSHFIDMFNSTIGPDSFVPIMARAFDEQARSNYVEAFLLSDAAINSATMAFTKLDDRERGAFYNLVLSRWRNLNLERAKIPTLFITQLYARYRNIGEIPPYADQEQVFRRHMKTYIKCLFLNDAYTVQLVEVLNSSSFQNCL